MATIAAMSSRGQIVLPIAIRKKLGLGEGSQFLVVTDNENILGLTEKEINAEIKSMRAEKRK